MDDIGVNDTFFDIGGHSLLVMKVITQVHEETGVKLGPQDFLISTLEQMADKLEESDRFAASSSATTTPAKDASASRGIGILPVDSASTAPTTPATPAATQPTAASITREQPKTKATEKSVAKEKKSVIRSLKGFWN